MSDDPFARLETAVRQQDQEEKAARAIQAARVKLILGKDAKAVFFATLALRLQPEVDWGRDTMSTDGARLCYNPEWVCSLPEEQRVGVITHEVMHLVLAHHTRRGGRDLATWNIAADLAVNPLIQDAGFKLPAEACLPGRGSHLKLPLGLSAEEYYSLLAQDQEQPQEGGQVGEEGGGDSGDQGQPSSGEGEGEGQGQEQPSQDPGGCGGVQSPGDGSPAAQRESEAEWEVAVAQAAEASKSRGHLPGGLARLVAQVLAPKVDWKEVLREFLSRVAANDYSWAHPNRRFIHAGIYLPGMRSEELGDVCLAVDTSGSIGQRQLGRFASEIQAILESYDVELTIIYHDSRVQHVQTWRSSDGPLLMEPKGGGGTSHRPVFDYIQEQGLAPTCLVCLTDLYTEFPKAPPAYPVLWASTTSGVEGPWGQTVGVSL